MEPDSVNQEIEQSLAYARSMMQKQRRQKTLLIVALIVLIAGLAVAAWWFSPYLPPAKVTAALDGVRVTSFDRFNSSASSSKWGFDVGEIKDGVLLVKGTGWRGLSYNKKFTEGEGIIVDFTYNNSAYFNATFNRGTWAQSDFKSFGFYGGAPNSYLERTNYEGNAELAAVPFFGNLTMEPGKKYSLLMAVLPDGKFLLVVWDPQNPDMDIRYYQSKRNSSWVDLSWIFSIGIDSGQVEFDNFREITFTSAK